MNIYYFDYRNPQHHPEPAGPVIKKKEKIQKEKRLKEQEKFYKKYGRNAIKAKYDGFDREGNRIKVGDIIKRTDKGWEKWKSK